MNIKSLAISFILVILFYIPLLAAADLSAYVENLGNPHKGDYPDDEEIYARNIWDLQVYHDRLYIGGGNSSNTGPARNAGPVKVYYYDIANNQFITDFEVDDEQIDLIKVLDGKLFIPGHDPLQSWSWGNFYLLDLSQSSDNKWIKYRNIPDAIHNYDMAFFNGKLFAALGVPGGGDVAISTDMGENWQTIELGKGRVYSFLEVSNQLFAIKNLKDTNYQEKNNYSSIYAFIEPDNFSEISVNDLLAIPDDFSQIKSSFLEADIHHLNYFLLTISNPLSTDVSVDYLTVQGSAFPDTDYLHTYGTATIKSGSLSTAIPVAIIADKNQESDQTFSMKIYNPQGAAFPPGSSEIIVSHTIIDDDSGGQNADIKQISAEDLFPGFQFDTSESGKIVRSIALDKQTIYIGAYTHNDHQFMPFGVFYIKGSEIKRITLANNDLPRDIVLNGNTVYLLVNQLINNTYNSKVLAADISDLSQWEEKFNFSYPAFARSFEYHNGDFYFGMGTEIEDPDNWTMNELNEESGELLRLKQQYWNP